MKKEWEDIITEEIGVEPIRINSNLFSAHNRPRIYWTNIPINELPKENKTTVYDILETPNFHNNYPKWLLGKFGNKTTALKDGIKLALENYKKLIMANGYNMNSGVKHKPTIG